MQRPQPGVHNDTDERPLFGQDTWSVRRGVARRHIATSGRRR